MTINIVSIESDIALKYDVALNDDAGAELFHVLFASLNGAIVMMLAVLCLVYI